MNERSEVGDVDGAEDIFQILQSRGVVPKHQRVVMNTVLKACANCGDVVRAECWLSRMRACEIPFSAKTVGKVLEAAVKDIDSAKAEKWYASINGDAKEDIQKVNMMIDVYARRGDVKGASAWMEVAKTTRSGPSRASYNSLLNAHAKAGEADEALALFEKIRAEGVVDVGSWEANTVLEALSKAGRTNEAVAWLGRMRDSAIELDVMSFNNAIDACAKARDPDRAAALLREAKSIGIVGTVVTYTSVINACAKAERPDEARRWFEEMQQDGVTPNIATFVSLLDACARAKRPPDEAEEWFKRMEAAGIRPNLVAFNSMINACAKGGSGERAVEYLSRMQSSALAPIEHSYCGVLDAFARRGDVTTASEWLQKMKDAFLKPDVEAYSIMVRACSQARDPEGAVAWVDRMEVEGVRPNVVSYTAAVLACARVRPARLDLAERLLHRLAADKKLAPDEVVARAFERVLGFDRFEELRRETGLEISKRKAKTQRQHDYSRRRVQRAELS